MPKKTKAPQAKNKPAKITVTDLYKNRIHGVTFTLIERALGAKVFSGSATVEVRLNFDGNLKIVRMTPEEISEFRDAVDLLHKVVQEKERSNL